MGICSSEVFSQCWMFEAGERLGGGGLEVFLLVTVDDHRGAHGESRSCRDVVI